MKVTSCVLVLAMAVVLLLPLVIPPDVSAKTLFCLVLRDKAGDDDQWEKDGVEPGRTHKDPGEGIEPVKGTDPITPDDVEVLGHRQRFNVWLHLTLKLVLSR